MSASRLHDASPGGRAGWRFGCALVAVVATLAGCAAPAARSATGVAGTRTAAAPGMPGMTVFPVAERAMVPAVSGETLTGGSLALRDLTGGDVVVVNVWASWCAPCRDEAAVLATTAAELKDRDVDFVGVDEADSAPAARRFVERSGTSYPQLLDPDGAILARLSVLPASGIPSTLVLDRRGFMAARVIGPLTSTSLHRVIAAAQGTPDATSVGASDTEPGNGSSRTGKSP